MKPALLFHLHFFLTVARTRSFTAAARELGVTPSAVSQSVRVLEAELRVVLMTRTTRSMSLTDTGRRLVEQAGPGLGQALGALTSALAQPGELVGRLKLTVPRIAGPYVIAPILPRFLASHPRIDVEVVFEDRLVDIIAEGYDAGIRLTESIERDMIQLRLTDAFRFVVAGAPSYFAEHGIPRKPEELLRHNCIAPRSQTTGELIPWDLERGRRTWRVPVKGRVVANDRETCMRLCEAGVGLMYAFEPYLRSSLRRGRLKVVLEDFAPTVPGFFLYFPSRAQRSPALRAFIAAAKNQTARRRS